MRKENGFMVRKLFCGGIKIMLSHRETQTKCFRIVFAWA